MQIRRFHLLFLGFITLLSSCKNDDAQTSSDETPVAQQASDVETFNKQIGIVRTIPASAEFVLSWHPDQATQKPFASLLDGRLVKHQTVLSFGKGAGKEMEAIIKLLHALSEITASQRVRNRIESKEQDPQIYEILHFLSSREGQARLSKFKIPPVTLAVTISDPEQRAEELKKILNVITPLSKGEDAIGEELSIIQPNEIFNGLTLDCAKTLYRYTNTNEASVKKFLGETRSERLFSSLEKHKPVLLVGEVDESIILFLGSSTSDLEFVEQEEESILADEDIKFAHQFAQKKVRAFAIAKQGFLQSVIHSFHLSESIAKGMKSGLATSTELSAKSHILEANLDRLADREAQMIERYYARNAVAVAYEEEGLKIEMLGGTNIPFLNLKSSRQLKSPSLVSSPMLSCHAAIEPEGASHILDTLESLLKVTQDTKQLFTNGNEAISGLDYQSPEIKDLFDRKFRNAILDSLGNEFSLLLDSSSASEKPSINYITTIRNVAKLQEKSAQLHLASKTLFNFTGEKLGSDLDLPTWQKSQSKNFLIWKPEETQDNRAFSPSMALSSNYFIFNNSPEDLSSEVKILSDLDGKTEPGFDASVNIEKLSNWANQQKLSHSIPKWLQSYKSLELKLSLEGVKTRSSIHLQK